MNRAFVYRPAITFASTNIEGNVYFANFVNWQGACREMFLKEHAPQVLKMVVERRIVLHTSRVSCEFTDPVGALLNDDIAVEMTLKHLRGGRMTVAFEYYREGNESDGLPRTQIASGEQSLCCKRISRNGLVPAVFPQELLLALRQFTCSNEILNHIDEALEFDSPAHDCIARSSNSASLRRSERGQLATVEDACNCLAAATS
jgi:enediyne biosynthesis thioesterase